MAGEKNTNDAIAEEADTSGADQTLIPPEGMEAQTVTVKPETGMVDDEPQFDIPPRKQGDTESLLSQLEEQKQLAAGNLDLALRAQAELDNARKRSARDIENAHKYALEKFVSELLPVLDSMELGLSAAGTAPDTATLREGMELTLKMFADVMEKFGVKKVDPQGEKFNPELHQAVSMQEQADIPAGTVISVMQKGYELNGRLVRPAMVVVAK